MSCVSGVVGDMQKCSASRGQKTRNYVLPSTDPGETFALRLKCVLKVVFSVSQRSGIVNE